ncbi:MAG: DUF2330 domain-containing protein [Labilithrix sp.]|nr:DUF2330 domain-containing protein [Labilithrix sp.]MCW5811019.1 DUF2330 domain-containing protein [Labilithrix sp.]
MKYGLRLFLLATVSAALVTDAGEAEACGGCFIPPADATVVNDHRMAFSISQNQTVLWDQIRYSGDPSEFAWVLPVKPGARIELANDEFFTALDTSTQPVVYAPQRFGAFDNAGCGLSGCADDGEASALSAGGGSDVEILSQSVVGPYDTVTLRATEEDALTNWLRNNDFVIPVSIEPTIAAYVKEGFDFIALKLRPTCGERQMRPVRVVSPGAIPTLPLRMVAAGVGPRVGITLYVITEGKYQPQNFPHALIDDDDLRWDYSQNKSNYEPLSQEIMGRDDGRTWVTEYADRPQLPLVKGWQTPQQQTRFGQTTAASRRLQTGLTDLYYGLCKFYRPPPSPFGSSTSSSSSSGNVVLTPCLEDGGSQSRPPIVDAGADADAGDDDDAGIDAGSTQEPDPEPEPDPDDPRPSGNLVRDCAYLDDLDLAIDGLARENVWVTRLRSQLPSTVLTDGDLIVEPAKLSDGRADTTTVSNLHWALYAEGEAVPESTKGRCDTTPRSARSRAGAWAIGVGLAFAGASWLRRRRRR